MRNRGVFAEMGSPRLEVRPQMPQRGNRRVESRIPLEIHERVLTRLTVRMNRIFPGYSQEI